MKKANIGIPKKSPGKGKFCQRFLISVSRPVTQVAPAARIVRNFDNLGLRGFIMALYLKKYIFYYIYYSSHVVLHFLLRSWHISFHLNLGTYFKEKSNIAMQGSGWIFWLWTNSYFRYEHLELNSCISGTLHYLYHTCPLISPPEWRHWRIRRELKCSRPLCSRSSLTKALNNLELNFFIVCFQDCYELDTNLGMNKWKHFANQCDWVKLNCKEAIIILNYSYSFTKRPVPCEHVGEIWNHIECGIHDIRYGEIHYEVVGNRSHPGVRQYYPDHWRKILLVTL